MEVEVEGGGEAVASGDAESPEREAEIEQVDESHEKRERNPRWLPEETLVLVAAKKKQAEEFLVAATPKNLSADERWEAVAAYCKANNCDRNAYQCRKRWFALYGDYNKVKDWHRSSAEPYWTMKNDRRRENRLPGTFDQGVFASMHEWLKKDSDADLDTPPGRMDEGLSSEIEQDVEGQEARGYGNLVPGSEHAGDHGDKRYRNPRWSLHESLILLAAKKKQEDDSGLVPKARMRTISAHQRWETISAHCRTQGCERNAYQCRKRWSALLGDFKRIKDWQKQSSESYWLMKNEKRKENKLPAIFDHEVFTNMDAWVGKRSGKKGTAKLGAAKMGTAKLPTVTEVNMDCPRPAMAGLLCDAEHELEAVLEPELPKRKSELEPEMGNISPPDTSPWLPPVFHGINVREELPSDSTARKKKKRLLNGDAGFDYKGQHLAAVFKSSVKAMQAALAENTQMQIQAHHTNIEVQIEAQNRNSELDRAQRKEQGENLVGVLQKMADALGKIAEKLT